MPTENQYKTDPSSVVRPLAFGAALFGLLFLVAAKAWAVNNAAAPIGGPPSVTHTVNLGPQLPGRIISEKQVIANHGSTKMHISKIITSCGCFGGDLRPDVIPPGKSATLYLKLTTHHTPGAYMVTAVLYGRTGSASVFRQYRFLYSVHRMIRVSGIQDNPEQSYYLNLGSTTAGAKPIPYRLTVTRGGYPAPWDSLKCSANAADLALDLNQKGKNNWLLTLLPKNLAILGSQSYMLRFSFYQKGKELRYHFSEPVNFKVRGPLEMEPDSVFFGAVPYGSTVVKHLQLVTSATGEIGKGRIVSATSTDPTHAVASIINGGKGLRVAFHAVHVRGRTTGRFLVTAEYGGSRYQFREDYLAYVGKQRPKAKVR